MMMSFEILQKLCPTKLSINSKNSKVTWKWIIIITIHRRLVFFGTLMAPAKWQSGLLCFQFHASGYHEMQKWEEENENREGIWINWLKILKLVLRCFWEWIITGMMKTIEKKEEVIQAETQDEGWRVNWLVEKHELIEEFALTWISL